VHDTLTLDQLVTAVVSIQHYCDSITKLTQPFYSWCGYHLCTTLQEAETADAGNANANSSSSHHHHHTHTNSHYYQYQQQQYHAEHTDTGGTAATATAAAAATAATAAAAAAAAGVLGGQYYEPGLLDDPAMSVGRHKQLLTGDEYTGPIVCSILQFVKPK
jgi:hypothetical protein